MKKLGLFILAALIVTAMSSCVFLTAEHEHQFGDEWVSDDASHWHVCSGEECTEISDKAEHTGGTATETEKAKCEVCGAEYGELKAHEHAFGEWQPKTPATCTATGVEIRTCACGAEDVRDVAKLDHSYTEEVADEKYLATANCGEQATYYKSCVCGECGTDTFAYGDVIAHNYSAVVTAPTCTEAGYTTYTCTCGDSYVSDNVAALNHNMVNVSDDTHHWTECDREGCDEATEKVAHTAASISAVCNKTDAMQYDVLTSADFIVSATCECGKSYTVTDGITVENGTLALGANTVTVKVGEASADVAVEAVKFNNVVNGTLLADTYVNSGSNTSNYSARTDLYIYNTGTYRVLFRFNFSDALGSEYYNNFKDEAKVQFTFTVSNGVDLTDLPIVFKSYGVSDIRSNADFTVLTWKNYNSEYTLGWGDDNNTVPLLASEPVGNRAVYENGKLVITVTLRELEGCIDENGNAIFVLLTAQKDVKPAIASMENTEFAAPAVKVIFNEDHAHAYIEEVANADYLATEATCTTKATYYYSCSCGEASTATFESGEALGHSFSEWQTQTPATCLEAEVEVRACACGVEETQTGDAALGHDMQTKYDETNHWTECSRCDKATETVAHFGGEATETEQATCEGCGQKYGGLASHVHAYGEWQTRTAATCLDAELEYRKCECGAEETQTGDAALGHNMETKYDADNHWTECSRCDEATVTEAHAGGEATETEKAVCSTCGQSYGDLKEPEKQEYTIAGTIKDDTYIYSSGKNGDYTAKTEMGTYSDQFRVYLRYNFSDILNSADYATSKDNAKIQFSFAVSTGADLITDTTKFAFRVFPVNDTIKDIDFKNVTWNNVSSSGSYPDLAWGNTTQLISSETIGDKVSYVDGIITITIDFSAIESCIDTTTGDALFVFAIPGTSGIKVASMENTDFAIPAVKYVYEK